MTSMGDPALPPDPTGLRIGDGPWAVLAALASGDPERLAAAKAAQREHFRAQFGCYPEDATPVCPECPDDEGTCPIWLSMRDELRADETMAARERLRIEHSVAEGPGESPRCRCQFVNNPPCSNCEDGLVDPDNPRGDLR